MTAVIIAVWGLFVAQVALYIVRGSIWIDEAFYLYASDETARGLLPYRDYFYHRLPLTPAIYGPLVAIFGRHLIVGRILSGLFCLGLLALVWRTAARLSGRRAALLATALIAFLPWGIYSYITFTTYALEGLLIAGAFFCFATDTGNGARWAVASGLLLLAVADRYPLDFVGVTATLLIGAAWYRGDRTTRAWVLGSVLALAVLLLAFVLFRPVDAHAVWFQTFLFNRAQWDNQREFGVIPPMRLLDEFWLRVAKEARTLRRFFAPALLLTAGIVAWTATLGKAAPRSGHRVPWWVVVGGAGFVLASEAFYSLFLGNSPVQRLYVLPVAAVVAAITTVEAWDRIADPVARRLVAALVLVMIPLAAVTQAAPPVRVRGLSEIDYLASVGAAVARATPAGGVVLAFNPGIPGAAARDGMRGLEMGYYTFAPTWSDAQVRGTGMLNLATLREWIEQRRASAIVLDSAVFFGDRDMALMAVPYRAGLLELIRRHYVLRERLVPDHNQFPGATEIYVPAPDSAETPNVALVIPSSSQRDRTAGSVRIPSSNSR